jgi:hypothetical protein
MLTISSWVSLPGFNFKALPPTRGCQIFCPIPKNVNTPPLNKLQIFKLFARYG